MILFKKKPTMDDIVAVGGSIIGSIMIAFNLGASYTAVAYCMFLAGSIASIRILIRSKGPESLLYLNGYFTAVNTIGIISYGFFN